MPISTRKAASSQQAFSIFLELGSPLTFRGLFDGHRHGRWSGAPVGSGFELGELQRLVERHHLDRTTIERELIKVKATQPRIVIGLDVIDEILLIGCHRPLRDFIGGDITGTSEGSTRRQQNAARRQIKLTENAEGGAHLLRCGEVGGCEPAQHQCTDDS